MSYRGRDPQLVEVVLKLGVSLLISLGISALAGRFLVQYLDPQHASKLKAKRGKQELMKRLGRPDIQTNEHEWVPSETPRLPKFAPHEAFMHTPGGHARRFAIMSYV